MNEKQIKKIKGEAEKILHKEYTQKTYYTYTIWEKSGKKRAYFVAQEPGHGFDGEKIKELRRTNFYVDMISKKIIDQNLYASISEILNIKIEVQ